MSLTVDKPLKTHYLLLILKVRNFVRLYVEAFIGQKNPETLRFRERFLWYFFRWADNEK